MTRAPDWRVVLLAVVAISAVYVGWHLDRTWYPADDGALAHSAERLLQGQLPHRDYDDVYTGGLAYLNAAAFRLLGATYWSMRLVLMAVFLAWVPTVFHLALRFAKPLGAAGITLLAVAWSLPNYMAPMPSWYNLFLATFGIAALFRYLDTRRWRWLVTAGIAGGLSILVKVVGVYYVAGVLLFLVFQAHADSRASEGAEARRGVLYSTFAAVALLLFATALIVLVRRQAFAPELVHFVLPGALIAALLVHDEWRVPAGPSSVRFAALGRLMAPFVAGIAIPVALFLVPYARSGAIAALVNGVFILPTKRFDSASIRMLPLTTLLALVLPVGVIALGVVGMRRANGRRPFVLLVLTLALLIAGTAVNTSLYRLVWNSARMLLPALVVAATVVLVRRQRSADAAWPLLRSQVMLLLSVAAMCSLVQFPFSAAVYFCYVAPLVILAAVALCRYLPPVNPVAPAALVALYLAFAVLRINSAAPYGMGRFYFPASAVTFEPLAGGRAEVETPRVLAREYQAITYLLQTHARGGYTWASPDSPEIYFLAGLHNPTRSFYEFFDDSTGRSARILQALDAHGVSAIVENRKPAVSPPLPPDLIAKLEARYPRAAEIGPYQVRWR